MRFSRAFSLAPAMAIAGHLDDLRVRREPVNQPDGTKGTQEDDVPVAGRESGGQDDKGGRHSAGVRRSFISLPVATSRGESGTGAKDTHVERNRWNVAPAMPQIVPKMAPMRQETPGRSRIHTVGGTHQRTQLVSSGEPAPERFVT